MKRAISMIAIFLTIISAKVYAQPYTLQSVGLSKPFSLEIYFGDQGKGAFVKYHGQTEIIALRIKHYKIDTIDRKDGQPDEETFVWDEIVGGKVNGSYGLMHNINAVKNAWYIRKKDGKKFNLQHIENKRANGNDQYLLHGAMISFNHIENNKLKIQYPDGKYLATTLPDFDSPNAARQSSIADYNFDGFDDIAFSIPDAGMGVYREFSIWLYNPASKRFDKLAEPNYAKAKCSCLCDVKLDAKNKLLYTSCRGGARWWQDVYRYTSANKLLWIRSKEMNN